MHNCNLVMSKDGLRLVPQHPLPLTGIAENDLFVEKFNRGVALDSSFLTSTELTLPSKETYCVNKASLKKFLYTLHETNFLNTHFSKELSQTPETRGADLIDRVTYLQQQIEAKDESLSSNHSSVLNTLSKWCSKKTLLAVSTVAISTLILSSAYYLGALGSYLQ